MRTLSRSSLSPTLLIALCVSLIGGCDDDEAVEPLPEDLRAEYVIGVIVPPENPDESKPELDFAVERINAAGGIYGRAPLVLRRVPFDVDGPDTSVAIAEAFAADDAVVAVIGPGPADTLLDVAGVLDAAQKPFITPSASGGELLRAFAGSPYVWRTKISDIGQIEFILRRARMSGVERVGLVTRASGTGASFFNWFGFYATNFGFAADDVIIAAYSDDVPPTEAIREVLDAGVDLLVLVPDRPTTIDPMATSINMARRPNGELPFQVVLADTGIDLPTTVAGNPQVRGWGGYVTAATESSNFVADLSAISGVPSDAAAGHDAVLLIAYGLEVARGAVGPALAEGIQTALAGDGEVFPADAEGIAATLEAIRNGEAPDVQGVTGTLDFDPIDGVDLTNPRLGRWTAAANDDGGIQFMIEESFDLAAVGSLELRRSRGMFTPPGGGDQAVPAGRPTRMVALIVAASSTWENYRHQADALRQYHRLREMGVSDDDIVMVGADDLVDDPQNLLPGVIRNVPGGPDVYRDVTYDYAGLTPAQILAVLAGEESDETPIVVPQDPDAALFVYIAGHGGALGVVVDANTTEAGLSAASLDDVLAPTAFTETLCAMREAGNLRQAFIVIESCFSGVFGTADFGGIEAGCADGETTLDDVLLLTASNELENSLAAGYDRELKAWVGDEFSVAFADRIEQAELGTMLSVFQDIYQTVAGSHVGLYNTALNAEMGLIPAERIVTLDPVGQ